MMDNRQARRVNEAAREFAEAVHESLRTVSGRTAEAQERTRRLTEGFFAAVTEELQTGTERNR